MKTTSPRARTQKTQTQDMSNAHHQQIGFISGKNRLERRIIEKKKRNKKR
jgi:hypothetical protein